MFLRFTAALLLLALLLGGVYYLKELQARQQQQARAAFRAPAVVVSDARVELRQWPRRINAVGSLEAVERIDVASEVPGRIETIHFQSGATVKGGAPLVELDRSAEEAQLKALQAELELARVDYRRVIELRGSAAFSQSQLDRAQSSMDRLRALVEQQQALLEKRTLRAPFSGQLGLRLASVGEIVAAGTPIVTLQSLDPIYATFSVPEKHLAVLAEGQRVAVRVAAWKERPFPGKVTALSPEVDEGTRNLRLQATLPNPERHLQPGMFAQVAVYLGADDPVLTIPRVAVSFFAYGESVFVIEGAGDDLTVTRRTIRVGRSRDGFVEVLQGLEAGDRVVNTGQLKLRNGQKVRIDNSIPLSGEDLRP